MRRVQKILGGIFLAGVLIGGVGTGVAVVEYSSLAYGGEKLIGEDSLVTKVLDFDFEPDGRILEVAGLRYWGTGVTQEIEIDNTVPVGTVRYEVTYNEKVVTPKLEFETYEEEEAEENQWEEEDSGEDIEPEEPEREPEKLGYLRLVSEYHGDDFAILMENKDRMLEELRQGTISSYNVAYITEAKIKVNQETVPYIGGCYVIR
ncbi:MAG: hypothetical protein HFG74_02020 [Hungatella sp.]|nr:hypothetical protein [Hungatella sp.]